MTFGTEDFLQTLKSQIDNGELLLMAGEENAVLMHETTEKSSFSAGKKFEVLDGVGNFQNGHFAVLNNIPVTQEGRPVFEYRFSQRARLIEEEPGFVAIRVLRPTDESDTYVILTLWEEEASFKRWQESKAYENAHKKRGTEEGVDKQQQIFPRPSYVTTYRGVTESE